MSKVTGPARINNPVGVTAKPSFYSTLRALKQTGATHGFTALVWGDSNDTCIISCGGNTDWFNSFGATLDRRLCQVNGLHPSDRPTYQAVWVPASMGIGTAFSNMATTNSPYADANKWTSSGFAWVAGPLPGYSGSPSSCFAITVSNTGLRYLRYLLDQRNNLNTALAWQRNKSKFCVSLFYAARDTDTPLTVTTNTANTFAGSPSTVPATDVSGFATTVNVQVRDTSGPSVISGSSQSIDCRLPTGNAWQALTCVFTPWNTHLYGSSGTAQQYIEVEVPNQANTMCVVGGILLDDGASGGVRVIDLSYAGGSCVGRSLEDRADDGSISYSTGGGAFAGMGQRYMPALGAWIGEDWADRVEVFWSRLINPATGAARKATFNAAGISQNTPYSTIDALFVNLFKNDYDNGPDGMNKYVARITESITRFLAKNPSGLVFIAMRPGGGTTTTSRDDPYTNSSYTVNGTVKGLRSSWVSAIQALVSSFPSNLAVLDVDSLFQGNKATDQVRRFQNFGTTNGADIVNFDSLHFKPFVNQMIAETWGKMFEAA